MRSLTPMRLTWFTAFLVATTFEVPLWWCFRSTPNSGQNDMILGVLCAITQIPGILVPTMLPESLAVKLLALLRSFMSWSGGDLALE